MRSVCVFCGSSSGVSEAYAAAARMLARAIAGRGISLVYGGGNVGLMGILGGAALAAGGRVIGVTPRRLVQKHLVRNDLSELRVVESMQERKALMAELSDGFIALPGGFGTLDELFEMLAWTQLGFHRKPCAMLDVEGYFERLVAFLDHAVDQHFVTACHRAKLIVEREVDVVLDRLAAGAPPGNAQMDGQQRILNRRL